MRRRDLAFLVAMMASLGCERAADDVADPSVAITPMALEPATLERATGERVDVTELRRPMLLHFWASWCAPCRRELPALIEAAREHDARVIAISVDAEWAPVRAFFEGAPPPLVARDPAGTLARTLGVSELPDTYVIDAEGRATRRIPRALDWSSSANRAWLARMVTGEHRAAYVGARPRRSRTR